MCVLREWKEISALVWPAALSALLFTLLEVVDAAMLGAVGVQEMAGALLASTVVYLVLVFPLQALRALTPLAAQRAATAAPPRGLSQLLLAVSLGLGLVAAAVVVLIAQILPALGYDSGLLPAARTFLLWRAPFLPVELAFFGAWASLEGLAGTRAPLWGGLWAITVNLGLNLLLIPGRWGLPALGVAGAALATNFATLIGLLVLHRRLRRLLRRADHSVHHDRPRCRVAFDRSLLRQFIGMGWPLGLAGLLEIGGWLVTGLLIARDGTKAAAVHGVIGQLLALGLAVAQGAAAAAAVAVARAVGRGQWRLARRRGTQVLTAQLVLGLLLVGAIVLGGQGWATLFTSDSEVVSTTASLLPLAAGMMLAESLALVLAGVVEGTGRTRVLLQATLLFDVGFTALVLLGLGPRPQMAELYVAWLLKNLLKMSFLIAWLDRERVARVVVHWLVEAGRGGQRAARPAPVRLAHRRLLPLSEGRPLPAPAFVGVPVPDN